MITILCPPCQVRQLRFSHAIYYKLTDWNLSNLPPDYNSDLCNEGFVPKCECASCQYNRLYEDYKQQLEKEEAAINERMKELAKLPFYKDFK